MVGIMPDGLSFWMRFFKKLGRDLSKMHNLCFLTLLIDFIIIIFCMLINRFLISQIVIDIEALFSLFSFLFIPKYQINPVIYLL